MGTKFEPGRNTPSAPEPVISLSLTELTAGSAKDKEIACILKLQGEIGVALLASASLPETLRRCTQTIVDELDAAFARIWTLSQEADLLELQASAGLYTHLDGPHSRVPVGQYKIGLIAKERKPHLTNSVIGDPRVHNQEWAKREGMVAFAGYPLVIEDRLVGVLAMFSRNPLPETTLDALGNVANFIALGIERKRAEEASRASEEFSRRVLESASDCIKILDLDFHVKYMSPFGMKLMEVDDFGVCENADWSSFWQQPDRPMVMAAVNRALAGGIGSFHAFCPTMKGSPRWWDVSVSPIKDADGRVVKLLSSSRDITERKAAEDLLRNNHEQLESRVIERTAALQSEVAVRQKAEDDLRELSAQLLTLRDTEQRRIARDLHDSAGQLLTATTMNLASVANESSRLSPEGASALSHATELVQETIREIRVVSYLLHPPLLDERGLGSALRWYLEGFSERGGIRVDLEMGDNFGRLPVELETNLFRVVQECLTNIHRHSGSDTARIEISRQNGEIRVVVEDKGKGMPGTASSGVGLRGMRERVAHFGGTLEILSSGSGTAIVASVPEESIPKRYSILHS
ncbi:MAG: PAS domain-containing protein [Candidatus Sulfotelmatobacter sp.]